MEQRELTCIGCPMGCRITVSMQDGKVKDISGNTCKIGAEYAALEVSAPVRTVTTTVRVRHGALPVVPVKTDRGVPKEKVFEVMRALKDIELEAPVTIGQAALRDVCRTGADVVVTKDIERQQNGG